MDHESAPITVNDLREALTGLPGDRVVMAACPDDMPETSHRILNTISWAVRSTLYEPGRDRLLITASAPRGRYQQ